ncbi:MAG: prolipoprotein diacylglyceryl transferase [Bacilli bacterium]|nr:prolipoprotein diacylglyceryl transferase [Bacilli bacterium]
MINSFTLFGITIHFYSLCILLGIILAYFIITKEAVKRGIDKNTMSDIIFYGLLCGIVGARLYYVIFNFDYYSSNLLDIFKIWNGGLAIHGGILAGGLFVFFYARNKKISFLKLADIILPGVIVAQALGRWGNFFNQEAYGSMVSLDLLHRLLVPEFIIKGMYIKGAYYLPTFYFESIWCILGFMFMIFMRNKYKIKVGTITAIYLIWYSVGRFVIEAFRTDSLMIFGIKQAQVISVIGIIAGVLILIKKNRKLYKE